MIDEQTEVRRAVEAARSQPHGYVFAPPGASTAVVEALRALAEEMGREFMSSEIKNPHEAVIREYLARDRPTVALGDNPAFLENLKAIASGKVVVK